MLMDCCPYLIGLLWNNTGNAALTKPLELSIVYRSSSSVTITISMVTEKVSVVFVRFKIKCKIDFLLDYHGIQG